MKRLLLSVLLACLTACFDASSTRVTPEVRQTNSRAGLAILLDPQPRLHALSSEPNLSTHAWLAPAGWDVNAALAGYLTPRLKGKGLTAVPFSFAQTDVAGLYDSSASYPNPARIRARLCELGQAQNVDLLVVVYRQMVRDFIGSSIENLVGYGLVKHKDAQVHAYATLNIDVVHTRRCVVVGTAKGQASKALAGDAWRKDFNADHTTVPIKADEDTDLPASLTAVVESAALIAAQEVGVSF